MDYAIIIFAGAFATVMVLAALKIDHIEYMSRKKPKDGTDKISA
jgi:hypothetical protein